MRKGFTLIEVLVVVSIIILLIAILLPALIKGRDSAEEITCMNNQAALMQAQTMYTLEHDGYFPHYQQWIWAEGNLNNHPQGKLLNGSTNFMNLGNDYTSTAAPEYGLINPYVSDFNAHFCPTAPEMPVNGLKNNTTPAGNEVIRSYVQNSNVGPNGYLYDTINNPAELLVITEENTFIMNFNKGWQHPMNDGKLDRAWDSIGSIHRRIDENNLRSGYAAGVFADGHVEWVFSQSRFNNQWATVSFMTDTLENPDEIDVTMIDDSMDFSWTY